MAPVIDRGRPRTVFSAHDARDGASRITHHGPRPRDPGPRFNNRISSQAGPAALAQRARLLRLGLGLCLSQRLPLPDLSLNKGRRSKHGHSNYDDWRTGAMPLNINKK